MTLDEWFDKYFSAEYLNVQSPPAYKAQAKAELQQVLGPQATPSTLQKVAAAVGLTG